MTIQLAFVLVCFISLPSLPSPYLLSSHDYVPEIMHEYSNIVGYLDLVGCSMFDILPSSFKVFSYSFFLSSLLLPLLVSSPATIPKKEIN